MSDNVSEFSGIYVDVEFSSDWLLTTAKMPVRREHFARKNKIGIWVHL